MNLHPPHYLLVFEEQSTSKYVMCPRRRTVPWKISKKKLGAWVLLT